MNAISEAPHRGAPEPEAPRIEPPPAPRPGPDPWRRSPFLATVLSVMPGLGQVYCGYYRRGFVHAIVAASIITITSFTEMTPLIPLLSIFLGFFWLYNMIDAGRRAMLVNEALAGRGGIELPEDFDLPGLRGSLAGGAALIGLGALLLAHTAFGMPLDWLEEWWPAAVVAFGAYLVWKARQNGSGSSAGTSEEL